MKKIAFLMGAGVMALASCTSEGVVNPAEQQAGETPIGFVSHMPNMGRAGERGLENESLDFGVWAYKAPNQGGINAAGATVMDNYLVGYWDETDGYEPTASQNLYGTNWYYEGLGYNTVAADGPVDHNYTFHGNDVQAAASTSVNKIQYLKYWDRTPDLWTYFYACVPYNKGTFDPASKTMRFPDLQMSVDAADVNDADNKTNDYMFAYVKYENTTMATNTTGVAAGNKVNLGFKHLGAQIRFGFYEEIPGYKVELIGYSTGNDNVYALPAVKNADNSYSAGSYRYKGNPEIVFDLDNASDPYTLTYPAATDAEKTSNALVCPLWFYNPVKSAYTNEISNTFKDGATSKYSYGGWKGILPQANTCGFTLNVSFKLIAEDTLEEIYVRGARVFVPADQCNWLANTRYTYIFKITTAVPGQSADPGAPQVTPNDRQYLWPIIFDQVMVEGWTDEEVVTPLL